MQRPSLPERLHAEIDRTLGPVVGGFRRVALLDYPSFPNVGDSAIWLGQLAWLRRRGLHPVYSADRRLYSPQRLRRVLGDGAILLGGGGNLGDLWEDHQRFREEVVAAFPHNPIVLLPQTMYFRDAAGLRRAQRAFDAHPDLTLVLRDHASRERAAAAFRARTLLCPDMAFALGPLARPHPPDRDVVYLLRGDQERRGGADAPPPGAAVDWVRDEPALVLRLQAALRARVGRSAAERLRPALMATYAPAARRRLARGVSLLASGRRVVTDRLHGHILCLLLGIPHRLLDNSYGKNRAFYETWTRSSDLVSWGGDAASAAEDPAVRESVA